MIFACLPLPDRRQTVKPKRRPRAFFRQEGKVFSHTYWFDAAASLLLVPGFSLWAYLGEYTWIARSLLLCVAGAGTFYAASGPYRLRIDKGARTITYTWFFGLRRRVFAFEAIEKVALLEEKQFLRVCFRFAGEKKPYPITYVFVPGDEWTILLEVFAATDYRGAEEFHEAIA